MMLIMHDKHHLSAEAILRYPAAETALKHEKILEAASRLFRERGFAGVSVAEIMKATGLTHGPFYNHFASKEALMAESIQHASGKALAELDGTSPSGAGRASFVQGYLSLSHRDAPGDGCLMAALAGEIGREPVVRQSFTEHLRTTIEKLTGLFPGGTGRARRRETIQMVSTMVGALVLSRAVDDPALSAEILRDAQAGLLVAKGSRGH